MVVDESTWVQREVVAPFFITPFRWREERTVINSDGVTVATWARSAHGPWRREGDGAVRRMGGHVVARPWSIWAIDPAWWQAGVIDPIARTQVPGRDALE